VVEVAVDMVIVVVVVVGVGQIPQCLSQLPGLAHVSHHAIKQKLMVLAHVGQNLSASLHHCDPIVSVTSQFVLVVYVPVLVVEVVVVVGVVDIVVAVAEVVVVVVVFEHQLQVTSQIPDFSHVGQNSQSHSGGSP